MGHKGLKGCTACCCGQYGSSKHGRILSLESYFGDNTTQEGKIMAQWSSDEIHVIQRQMDFLSMQSKACPEINKADGCNCCDQACNEGGPSREIELCGESGLPSGWEQCLDLKTGEFYYIEKSSGKRTKRDPRPILKEVNKNIHALISSLWEVHAPNLSRNCPHFALPQNGAKVPNGAHLETKDSNPSFFATDNYVRAAIDFLNSEYGPSQTVEDVRSPILKGCRKCLFYFLIPREIKLCPLCKAGLFGV